MSRESIVLLPAPLGPTMAVVVPAGARNETLRRTGTPAVYSNDTASKATSPRTVSIGARCRFDLHQRRVAPAIADVLGDGAVEEERVLFDDAEQSPVTFDGDVAQVAAVERN